MIIRELDAEGIDIELELLLQAIYLRYQFDFRQYVRAPMAKRLKRLMPRFGVENFSQLQERLLVCPEIFPTILNCLTVPTTEFFRDYQYFLALRNQVFPFLLDTQAINIWIPGCSTGEEVFSIAIFLKEAHLLERVTLYATDINPNYLNLARQGVFDNYIVEKATHAYLKAGGQKSLNDYFTRYYDNVQFDLDLIKNAVFYDHNVAIDDVIEEMNFVSMRNVLSFFNRKLQDLTLGKIKEALTIGGFLGLGEKESLSSSYHQHWFSKLPFAENLYQRTG